MTKASDNRPQGSASEQASARTDDLALRLPNAHRHQHRVRRLASNNVAGSPHLLPRNHRGADRDLRLDAASASASHSTAESPR